MLRVALAHDWLVGQRGGEHVLRALASLYPEAPIFTLVHTKGSVDPEIERHRIRTSFVQRLPGAPAAFRRYLPLFPRAVESWDLSDFDLVVSTSHCVAKGVLTHAGQTHISYIHTPMRYLWDQLPEYLPKVPGRELLVPLARTLTTGLRRWDVKSASRPDQLIANSAHVARRIKTVWRQDAAIVYPPVDLDFFMTAPRVQRTGYLVVSALVPYKRVDAAIRGANAFGLQLTVIGDGPERARLERMAGPTVRFVGEVGRAALRQAYASARALIFCGIEDFGIVPVEAIAAGCPVVALGEGGALETVVEGVTGHFFCPAQPAGIRRGIESLERSWNKGAFDRQQMAREAGRFATPRFLRQMRAIIHQALAMKRISRP